MPRSTDYKNIYPEDLINKMSQGLFDYEVCASWDICRATFYNWLKEYPELKDAYEIGYNKCYSWWMTEGRKKFCQSEDGGGKYWQHVMYNKFGEGRTAAESSKVVNQQITIGNMNVLQSKDTNELLDFISDKLNNTNLIDIIPESDGSEESTE